MRTDEKVCLRCKKKFESGQMLLSVHEFMVHGDREFAYQTMRYVHLDCPEN